MTNQGENMKNNINLLPITIIIIIAIISIVQHQKARQGTLKQESLEYSKLFYVEMPHQNLDINELNIENPKVKILK